MVKIASLACLVVQSEGSKIDTKVFVERQLEGPSKYRSAEEVFHPFAKLNAQYATLPSGD